MRFVQTRLFSFAAPLMLVPVLFLRIGQIPGWFEGVEFRTFLSELLIEFFASIADVVIVSLIEQAFGIGLLGA